MNIAPLFKTLESAGGDSAAERPGAPPGRRCCACIAAVELPGEEMKSFIIHVSVAVLVSAHGRECVRHHKVNMFKGLPIQQPSRLKNLQASV